MYSAKQVFPVVGLSQNVASKKTAFEEVTLCPSQAKEMSSNDVLNIFLGYLINAQSTRVTDGQRCENRPTEYASSVLKSSRL